MKMKKGFVVAIGAIGIIALVASGAMIDYLSNTVITKTTVEGPPLELSIKDEEGNWVKPYDEPMDFGTIHGSDNISWEYMITKLAHMESDNSDVQLEGELICKIHCPDGAGTKEIDYINITIVCEDIDLNESLCYTNDGNDSNDDFKVSDKGDYLQFDYVLQILFNQWGCTGKFEIIFNKYALGEYTTVLQVV